MAHYVDRLWNPEDTAHLVRKDRTPGRYRAYVPGELGEHVPQLGRAAQQAAEDALSVLARADERIGQRGGYLNHLLIRSESISSSWIEGNRITPKKLAIAELLQQGQRVALDVVANVRATDEAIADLADRGRPVTTADIERLQHIIEPRLELGLRTEQNWVGGPGWSPIRADFVPPPETEVPRLVDDLARFITATEGNPVVRAAIAHAQFETIHPFIDGNGRTGRALIHTVLRRADALRNTLIPISTVFAGDKDAYIEGLTAYRAAPSRLDDWVIGFAHAAELAATNAVRLSDDIADLDRAVRGELIKYRKQHDLSPTNPRSDAVVLRILDSLATDPVLSTEAVATQHKVSAAAAHRALVQLGEAGILTRNKDHKGRLIFWAADRHLALVALTERDQG
ncbi:Fic family protein [Cryobacterium sp. N22]|uniref:Fic family protein n=1 Tax=Cryobacterium sp. N22 TaxID=2048290 RepID=UPI000CE3A390|nr:Fic family protein [Cryobacterium sp. N22]